MPPIGKEVGPEHKVQRHSRNKNSMNCRDTTVIPFDSLNFREDDISLRM